MYHEGMALERGLHIKVDSDLSDALKRLSAERGASVGELVRRAIRKTYVAGLQGLSERQGTAVAAYDAGYISLGKLAEELAMDAITLRAWLAGNGFGEQDTFSVTDAQFL
jgi:hypothetical protein